MEQYSMIDPEKFQPDVLALITRFAAQGLHAYTAGILMAGHDSYFTYPDEHVIELTKSTLEKLADQGLVVLKGEHYFPGKPVSILQDTPARPEEYLPPEITGGKSS